MDLRDKEEQPHASETAIENSGPTIIEIIHDEQDSKQFGQMLETEGKKELGELAVRMRNGDLNETDMKQIEKYRLQYLETKERVSQIGAGIDARLAEMRAKSKTFNSACAAFGGENYASVLKQGLNDLAFTKPAEFKTDRKAARARRGRGKTARRSGEPYQQKAEGIPGAPQSDRRASARVRERDRSGEAHPADPGIVSGGNGLVPTPTRPRTNQPRRKGHVGIFRESRIAGHGRHAIRPRRARFAR